jgi:hypothetical protein
MQSAMSRWFRMYDEIIDDPKVQRLPAGDFKSWVNLLCLASRHGGKLPAIPDIAFALRESEEEVSTRLQRLRDAGLIERRNGGANGIHHAPHAWEERQYKSDSSTDRVRRFRQRSRTTSETPPESEPETESESDQSPPAPRERGDGPGHDVSSLASDLCRRAGIARSGPAAIRHVTAWLDAGIEAALIRAVVDEMVRNAGGKTRSLSRFDRPVKRAHAELRPSATKARSEAKESAAEEPRTRAEPQTKAALLRAIEINEHYGLERTAALYRSKLAALEAPADKEATAPVAATPGRPIPGPPATPGAVA